MVFIQVFIRKNRFNTASNWSVYWSGHAHLAIKKNGRRHNWHCLFFKLVYGYWKYHEMGVLIFILHYVLVQTLKCGMCRRQPPLHIAFIVCILHISVLVNIGCFDSMILVVFYTLVYWLIKVSWNGCFDINPVLCPSTVVLSRGQLYWPEATCLWSIQLYET